MDAVTGIGASLEASGTGFAFSLWRETQTRTGDVVKPERNEFSTYKRPPQWRQPLHSREPAPPPKGERDASHDPPLALSHRDCSNPRQAVRIVERVSQPARWLGGERLRER